MKFIKILYYKNCISNHLLNLSCTIADGGALGAILWFFELRELLIEECEEKLGTRLHINISFSQYILNSNNVLFKNINVSINLVLIDLLIYGIIYLRVIKSRLIHNMILNIEYSFTSACTGTLLNCSGIIEYNDRFLYPNLISSLKSDSLVRHILRVSVCILWEYIVNKITSYFYYLINILNITALVISL